MLAATPKSSRKALTGENIFGPLREGGPGRQALARALKDAHNPVVAKLDAYRAFAAAYGADFDPVGQPAVSWTFEIAGGNALRLVGLCSVLISDLEDRPDNMFLGADQYALPRQTDVELIVLVHHPAHWFMNSQVVERYPQSRARVLMTGHEHLPPIRLAQEGSTAKPTVEVAV